MEATIMDKKNDEPQQQNVDQQELVDDEIMFEYLFDNNPQKILPIYELYKRKCQNNNEKVSRRLMSIDIVRFMQKNKFCINSRVNAEMQTPLHLAFYHNDLECAMLLLKHGADVDAMCAYRNVPFAYYSKFTNSDLELEVLKIILQQSTTLSQPSISRNMPVARLLEFGKAKALLALFESNFNLRIKDNIGRNSLHYLATNPTLVKNKNVMNALRKKSLDIHVIDYFQRNALHYAADNHSLELLKFLLERKADVNLQDCVLMTPLFLSSNRPICVRKKIEQKMQYNCAKLLLQHGADLQHRSSGRKTIFNYVLPGMNSTLSKLIITHLVILEARGVPIDKFLLKQIDSNHVLLDQYNSCKIELAQLKKIEIPEFTTLYKFLCETDEKRMIYLQNTEFYSIFKDMRTNLENKSEFFNIYWGLMDISIKKAEVRRKVADLICEITEFSYEGHRVILDEILQYLTDDDFEKFQN